MQVLAHSAFILPLNADEATLDRVGGKGVSLAKMAQAGLPVPAGFHLTTAAYHRFIEVNALQAVISEITAEADATEDTSGTLGRAEATIRTRFEEGVMPDEVAEAIRQAYDEMGASKPAVAVRSSATAEDLPELSFAGQQESYLNVRGEAALLAAVRRCWASLWTARAMHYRRRMGIDQETVAMAVVVQRMVPADVSGVLFTANPTTGERGELVVNAGFGLGEAVVSGQMTPDVYIVDKVTHRTKALTLGAKEVMVVSVPGQGTATEPVSETRRDQRALSDLRLSELAALAMRVEESFGGVPQDIEWAIVGGQCWLLQARPITHLPPPPLRDVRWEPPEPKTGWIRRQVVENMPEPLSPLFAELYLRSLDQSVEAIQSAMGLPSAIVELIEKPFFTTVNGYAYMRATFDFRWSVLPTILVAMTKSVRSILREEWVAYWRDEALPGYVAAIEGWKCRKPQDLPEEELLQGVRELTRADAEYWFGVSLAVGIAKVFDAALDGFLAGVARGRGLTSGMFLRGFASKTVEAQVKLEAIAQRIRESEALRALVLDTPVDLLQAELARTSEGEEILEALQGYLDRFGYQIYTLDFAEPTQADDPLPTLVNVKSLVHDPGQGVRNRQRELAAERERAVEQTAQSFGSFSRWLFRWLVRKAQRFAPYREEALFYVGAAWPTLRRLAYELGRRFIPIGALTTPDDVFYLEVNELEQASKARVLGKHRPDLAQLAIERRALREARKRLQPPAAVPPEYRWKLGPVDLSSRETQRRNAPDANTLAGFAVSPGRVSAPASVILSPAHFGKMEPGTILVCPTTTPAWTPLFTHARGLVTDIGGILAHGSIVAREYGIPAVMGTGSATQRISHGQQVTVDGNEGTVTLTD